MLTAVLIISSVLGHYQDQGLAVFGEDKKEMAGKVIIISVL